MIKTMKVAFLLMVLVAFQSCAQKDTKKVDFLIGTWQIEGKLTFESWKLSGNRLVGESYKLRDNQKYISETLKIEVLDDNIIYTATVKNQNAGKGIPFELAPVKEKLYSFENLTHDFPNKIQYKVLSKTELLVNVLGKEGKGFSYKLIKQD